MIINDKIYQRKIEEFRKYYGVTYVDEEMHKDPKLERYYMNKYPMPNPIKIKFKPNTKALVLTLCEPIVKLIFKCTDQKSTKYKLVDECFNILKNEEDTK